MAKVTVVNKQDLDKNEIQEAVKQYALEYGRDACAEMLFVAVADIVQGRLPQGNQIDNQLPATNISNIMGMLGGNMGNMGNVRALEKQRQRRLR